MVIPTEDTILPKNLPATALHMPSFWAGIRAFLPLSVGVFPFAVIVGVSMVSIGMSPWNASIMNVCLNSGAAQVAVVGLMAQGAPVFLIIATGVIINLRFLMYSAGSAPYMQGLPLWRKAFMSYTISDQAFAVAMVEFHNPNSIVHPASYYTGINSIMYCTWTSSALLGIAFGAAVPSSWQLDFAVPLSFLSLLQPSLRDRTHVFAALVAAAAAVLGSDLPSGLGLVLGAVCGISTGVYLTHRKRQERR